jgi:hypothetical protein
MRVEPGTSKETFRLYVMLPVAVISSACTKEWDINKNMIMKYRSGIVSPIRLYGQIFE